MTEQQTLAQADEYVRAAERLAEAADAVVQWARVVAGGEARLPAGYVRTLGAAVAEFERVKAK